MSIPDLNTFAISLRDMILDVLPGRLGGIGVFGSLLAPLENRGIGDFDFFVFLHGSSTDNSTARLRIALDNAFDYAAKVGVLFCHAPVVVFDSDFWLPNPFLCALALESDWVVAVRKDVIERVLCRLSQRLADLPEESYRLAENGLYDLRMILLHNCRYQTKTTELHVFKHIFFLVARAIIWISSSRVVHHKMEILKELRYIFPNSTTWLPISVGDFEQESHQQDFRFKCCAFLESCLYTVKKIP